MSSEEAREAGRRGGIASGEAKRRKKAIRETAEVFLSMPLKNGKHCEIEDVQNFAKLKGKNLSVQEAMVIAQVQRALKGDKGAFELLLSLIGEKPTEAVSVQMNVNPYDELSVEELRELAKHGEEN